MIDKGFISSIDEDKKLAVIVPMSAGAAVTHNLVIPYFLRECLQVNMPVVYATFEDNTGIILARMDGEYGIMIGIVNGKIKRVPLEECAGKLKMVSPKDQTVKAAKQIGISFGD